METLIQPPNVLVVEPDKLARKNIRKALSGMDLTFVPDAEKAIAAAMSREPAVVLMATDLPSVDGFELLKRLRVHPETMDVPVVMMTADPERAGRFAPEGHIATVVLAKEDLGLLKDYIPKLIDEKTMMKAFREAYSRVLLGAAGAASALTGGERAVLESAGFPMDAEVDPTPVAARAARFGQILSTSLTTQRAARKLGVNASRIRQRLAAPPELYGIRRGNEWLLPAFQFGSRGLVPNIDKVIARLSPGIDPVAVDGWFRRANVDLVHDGQSVSPLQWLGQGLQFETVASLAEDL